MIFVVMSKSSPRRVAARHHCDSQSEQSTGIIADQ